MAQGPGISTPRPGEEALFWPQVFSGHIFGPGLLMPRTRLQGSSLSEAQEIEVLGVLSPVCSRYHCSSHVSQTEVSVAHYRIRAEMAIVPEN